MICFTSSLIRQLYHSLTDFDRMLLQLTYVATQLFKIYLFFKNYASLLTYTNFLVIDRRVLSIFSGLNFMEV